jgi:DNA-binding HxlR family transcriptional regulator
MADTGDYCPMTRAADVFATRWTPVVVRNLLAGCRTFTEIRDHAPGISRTVLTERLRMLEHHALLDRRPQPDGTVEYTLTPAGEALRPVCDALGMWGERWLELTPAEVDAGNVLRWLVKGLMPDDLPEERVVVRFDLAGPRPRRYWLLLERPAAEVCKRPPGPADDLVVSTTSEWIAKWHTGRTSVGESMKAGAVTFDGPLELARRVAGWGGHGVYDHEVLAEMAAMRRAAAAARGSRVG